MHDNKIYKIPDSIIKEMLCKEIIFTSANIIKELVNNSVDSHATNIEIHANDNNITVKDNGCGMSLSDLLICKQEYTTSKSMKDINTLGFRGMALYHINQICNLDIQTRTCEQLIAIQLNHQNQIEYVHGDTGTIIRANDIRIHISSKQQVIELIKQYIVVHNDIKFKLYIKDKLYNYTKDQILFDKHKGIYEFHGRCFHGLIIKNNKHTFYIYFNKNYIFHKDVHDSIIKAWKQVTSGKENISYVIYITLENIGINANKNHIEIPNKEIYEDIHSSVLLSLQKGTKHNIHTEHDENKLLNHIKFLSTLHNRYILCSDEKNDLILIDAHAAHERIIAEQFKKDQYYMQALLSNIIINIEDCNIPNKNLNKICKFYIQDNFIFITHVISILYYLNEELILMFERILYESHVTSETILLDFFHNYGCRNAIRHHHYLSEDDCINIIQQLFQCDHYEFCNHGRRTYYRITISEINRIFER